MSLRHFWSTSPLDRSRFMESFSLWEWRPLGSPSGEAVLLGFSAVDGSGVPEAFFNIFRLCRSDLMTARRDPSKSSPPKVPAIAPCPTHTGQHHTSSQ